MQHGPRASLTLLAAALVLGACQGNRPPTTTQDQGDVRAEVLTLRIGDVAYVNGIEIRFGGVPQDSRCAVDVLCVAAGNARVEMGVGPLRGTAGPTYLVVVNSLEEPRSGEALGLRLTLLSVSPAPVSTRPIPPEDYEIEVRVEPADGPG